MSALYDLSAFSDWLGARGIMVRSQPDHRSVVAQVCGVSATIGVSKTGEQSWPELLLPLRDLWLAEADAAERLGHTDKLRRSTAYWASYAGLVDKRKAMQTALSRDGARCWYCSKPDSPEDPLTIEHLISRANGGPDSAENIVPACRSCNGLAGSSHLSEKIQMKLQRIPGSLSYPGKTFAQKIRDFLFLNGFDAFRGLNSAAPSATGAA